MTFDLSSAVKMKLYLSIPIGIMLLLAVAEPSQIDLWLTDQLYQPGVGFIGEKSFFLEDILHDRAKEAAIGVVLIAFCGWLASYIAHLEQYRLSNTMESKIIDLLERIKKVNRIIEKVDEYLRDIG